ncbi:HNH endonuclease [Catenulispora sp. NF23]|uniref:HNH endonuclease n=1 Tax=Catenulispora pinistramenti TaxID=2705254 RepID=A0ABS5KJ27_9ACTN|nr:HNH endonuclease [Catenulispora pinistramenti]MBS2546391.1 HNH endonuclease [Catenulispora pinistramenti]
MQPKRTRGRCRAADQDCILNGEKVIRNARGRCEIGGPRCTGRATTADHIIPLAYGGTHDRRNLRAECLPCNCGRGRRTRRIPEAEFTPALHDAPCIQCHASDRPSVPFGLQVTGPCDQPLYVCVPCRTTLTRTTAEDLLMRGKRFAPAWLAASAYLAEGGSAWAGR